MNKVLPVNHRWLGMMPVCCHGCHRLGTRAFLQHLFIAIIQAASAQGSFHTPKFNSLGPVEGNVGASYPGFPKRKLAFWETGYWQCKQLDCFLQLNWLLISWGLNGFLVFTHREPKSCHLPAVSIFKLSTCLTFPWHFQFIILYFFSLSREFECLHYFLQATYCQ